MQEMTRRAALQGTAAVATCVVTGTAVAAVADDPAIRAAADWHECWDRLLASAGLKIGEAYSNARERMAVVEPTTTAGAVALLGCAATVIETREHAFDYTDLQFRVPRRILYDHHGEAQMSHNAYRALARLVGEG